MPRKNKPTGTDADITLMTLSAMTEDQAREYAEKKRWPNGPVCPHCQCKEYYTLTPKATSNRPVRKGVYKCKGCRKQFTVRVGSIFEDSKLPIRVWLLAIHMMCASKKGVSSHQLARQLDITQKSAWFVCHRVREAMRKEPMAGMLKGEVEVDETYVGARRPRYKGTSKHGRGTSKQPVLLLVERGGGAVAYPINGVTSENLKGAVRSLVNKDSLIVTDSLPAYVGLDKDFTRGHKSVNHHKHEYVRREPCGDIFVSTNTAESFFGLLKRGHMGTFHQLSKRHLHRYCDEFVFRWDRRKITDGERVADTIRGAEGKRLMYREPCK